MLYALSGMGTMPPKEAVSVLRQLLEEAEEEARTSGEDGVDFWLALDPDKIDGDQKFWQAVSKWATDEDIFVADTGDLKATIIEAQNDEQDDRVVLLAIPSSEDFSAEVDWDLCGLVDTCTVLSVPVKCFNGQMYEVEFESSEEPVPAFAGPAPMSTWSLGDLKAAAREMGVVPSDWRSKTAIIEAIEAADAAGTTISTPTAEVEVQEVDVPFESAPEPEATEQGRSEIDDDYVIRLVQKTVREEFASILMDAFARLGLDD